MQHLVVGDDRGFDPVEAAQEREARRRGAGNDRRHEREALVFHMAIERGEVFDFLPRADAIGSDQQQERVGLGDFLGELGQPEACTERDRRKEDLGIRFKPGKARANRFGEGRIPGIERQEYPHAVP